MVVDRKSLLLDIPDELDAAHRENGLVGDVNVLTDDRTTDGFWYHLRLGVAESPDEFFADGLAKFFVGLLDEFDIRSPSLSHIMESLDAFRVHLRGMALGVDLAPEAASVAAQVQALVQE